MQIRRHRLLPSSPGTQHELVSLHCGPSGGRKAYIQASLHADEVPAMLVAHHLRLHLTRLHADNRLRGEVVLVPAANPIGLGQQVLGLPQGRFDLASGENFNRGHADLSGAVADALGGRLGTDAEANAALVRDAARAACAALPAPDTLASLRRTLLGLAIDADTVLDLHCDNEAVLHLYTAPPAWPLVQPLAQRLGAPLTLLATDSGGSPFDEACSMLWPRLAALFDHAVPLPAHGCVAVTVELRGEADVSHALAERDAAAIVGYLADRGFVDGGEPLKLARGRDGLLHATDSAQLRRWRTRLAFVFQNFNLWQHRTTLENVTEAPIHALGMTTAEAREQAHALLVRVGLGHRADAFPAQLSGGEQQRVAIARALAMSPEVLLFDEPTSALDPERVGEVLQVMRELAGEHRTMLVVTHEMAFAREVSTQTIFLHQGRIEEQGPPAELFGNPRSERLRQFLGTGLK